jgi:Ni,Fe-hydrogenase III small subunit/formate hydrogenlyase subunit 6/NADH:ubiquinone oxidoreductase subunit I
MLRIIKERLRQKYRTLDYPNSQPALSPRYLGRPELVPLSCDSCCACYHACPTAALLPTAGAENGTPTLDMGRCTFCGACRAACPKGAFAFTKQHRMASFSREGLLIVPGQAYVEQSAPVRFSLFRRSLKLRQVSAGGCNACESDSNVLTTLVFDLGRFGIDFAASPRHADAIAVTGPVSENMRLALLDTFKATPQPRLVIAVGACAISGGLFRDSDQCNNGVTDVLPVDLYIPGCPPNPWTILDGLLSLQKEQAQLYKNAGLSHSC